ncbi:DUF2497 domain-containing protein [Acetobacter sp.]|jgi:cell pole-organizing protein PopZ|uniref:DUF2497 domain-containing protein n=1 Tax=Acetobacter sp. TaxID=440 RepID=UPI0025C23DCA|nr:DUF2497 domain-containing protein [Acetobacter sp.]MCH4090121.1 DUF2497 domain-containing protein [Acetobacter sp.]MCI1298817.1 DUF2497 domain-containing protein [Acetobacter sp.]MCI1314836.1 DUF2497 domain-containing protein [Acetobacter sp.]
MTENNDTQPENGSINTVLSSIRRILQEGKEAHAASQQAASALQPETQPETKPEEAVAPSAPPPQDDDDSVLVLDSSMFAHDEEQPESHEPVEQQPHLPVEAEQEAEPTPEPAAPVAETPAEPEHVAPPISPAPEPEPVSAEPAETHESVTAETEIHVPAPTLPTSLPVVSPLSRPVQLVETTESQQARTRMSENRTPAEAAAGYSDSDAPLPVQIALDKQTVGATEHSFGALQQMLRRKQSFEHKERRVSITRGGNLTIEDIVRDEVRAFLKEWLDQHLSGIVQQAVQKEIERLSDR